jgi:hypothetical protein
MDVSFGGAVLGNAGYKETPNRSAGQAWPVTSPQPLETSTLMPAGHPSSRHNRRGAASFERLDADIAFVRRSS